MITITDRRSTDGFLQLYKSHGVTVSMRTVGSGTAVTGRERSSASTR